MSVWEEEGPNDMPFQKEGGSAVIRSDIQKGLDGNELAQVARFLATTFPYFKTT